jgi:hypothetical protein
MKKSRLLWENNLIGRIEQKKGKRIVFSPFFVLFLQEKKKNVIFIWIIVSFLHIFANEMLIFIYR